MASVNPYSIRPAGLMRLNNFTREEVSIWFDAYNVSFRDINDFCEKVFDLRYEYGGSNETGASDEVFERGKQGSDVLWAVLEDIAGHSSHRHRRDALNIMNEVKSREAGEDENVLIPEPLPMPHDGPDEDRLPTPYDHDDEVLTPERIERSMSERMPNDPLPVPVLKIPPPGPGIPPPMELPENDELINYLPAAGTLEASAAIRDQIMINLSQGTLDPGLTPYIYRDDPGERVLNMNNDIEFITAPTPDVNPELLDSSTWPMLDIYDNRLGTFGALRPTSYIYKLIEWCRLTIAQPGIARAYCIIFRANPRRYNEGSGDELQDEEPPQGDELECIIKFITHMTPSVWIFRNDVTSSKSGCMGYHRRSHVPHAIQINGLLFDAAEKAHREGHSPAHMLYIIWVTFIHECGHYYNTLIHKATSDPDGMQSRSFQTPRKLRFLISGNPALEDRNFATYDPWHIMRGEMGELIEWLIFGYAADTTVDGNYAHVIYVIGWGSYPAQMGEQILFSSLLAGKLLRVPMRFTCDKLRLFMQQVYAEALQAGNAGSDEMWEIMGFMTHYAPPTQQAQAHDDSDSEMTDVSESEYSDDSDGTIQYVDVDAALTGNNLSGGQDFTRYRRSVWRAKVEIDAAYPVHPEGWIGDGRRPPGRMKKLNPPNLMDYIYPRIPRERWEIPVLEERNTPSRLPDLLKQYILLFGMIVLFVLGLWGSWVLDEWYIYGSGEDEAFWAWFVVLPLEVLFIWAYVTPLRKLLKPLGMRGVARRFSDW